MLIIVRAGTASAERVGPAQQGSRHPSAVPSAARTRGWYARSRRSPAKAACMSRRRFLRSLTSWVARRSMTWWPAPPPRLAWYIAASASTTSWWEMSSPGPAYASPTLADAGSRSCSRPGRTNGSVERADHPGGERLHLRHAGQVLAQEHELVAVHAGERVARPDHAGQPLGDGAQHLVADLVAVGVVDRLELVEVDEQHAGERPRPLGALTGVLEPLLEQHPVGQPGEGVVQRAAAELVRGLLGVLTGLRVDQVGGGDVGQDLRGGEVALVQQAGAVAVEVQRTESALAVVQREGEHRGQAGSHRPGERTAETWCPPPGPAR